LCDSNHVRAVELSLEYQSYRHVTTDAVILEIGNAMARSFKPQAAAMIRKLLSMGDAEVVRLNPDLLDKALSTYESFSDKEWGLVDCISFQVMRERGIEKALTADHHFTQAGFQALMRP